jgi:hypothetical protein
MLHFLEKLKKRMAKIKSITFRELLLSLFTDMSAYAEEGSAKRMFNAPCFCCVCQHLMHAVSNNTVFSLAARGVISNNFN